MSNKQKAPGETMTNQTVQTVAHRYARIAEAAQDALVVSSFGLWALLLGFVPVVAICMLRGN